MDARRRNLLIAWLAAPFAELWAGWGACDPPSASGFAVELAALGAIGALQARFAPAGWARSPCWPGIALAAGAGLRGAPDGPLAAFCFVVGAAALCVVAARVLDDLLRWRLAVALGWVVAGALGGRYIALVQAPVAQPAAELLRGISPGPAAPAGSDGPPLVVITVDTLRADHAPQMETWRRLGDRGATWDRAMSTSSWTVPALASLQTGAMPGEHDAGAGPTRAFQRIDSQIPTLAERLQGAGYDTAAFVANPFASSALGFDRGFRVWNHPDEAAPHRWLIAPGPARPHPRDGVAVVDRALRWLDDAPERGIYLWVHLMDPHLPYRHAPPGSLVAGLDTAHPLRDGTRRDDDATRDAIRAAYADEVAWADRALQPLLDALDARGVFDEGAVVFTSDHGEEFWEHGGIEHGHTHHGEVVDVPLALVAPGVSPGARGGVASLVDVAVTLGEIAGLPEIAGGAGLDLRAGVPADRAAAAAGNLYFRQQRSARGAGPDGAPVRVIATDEVGVAAWDLAADPYEQSPLDPTLAPAVLETAVTAELAAPGEAADVNMEALRRLGYVE